MRKNEPVSQHEIDYRDSAIILSRSDRKGVVTEVNRDFSEISGFSHDESIGKPHNFLRHPDMPAVAFADLWRTIKSGRLWHGIVKNRAKNGDHYWVEANVAPVLDAQGKVTAYVSVRTKPSRAQINAAEALYQGIASGRARLPKPPVAARRLVQLLVATPIVALAVLGALGVAWPVLVAVAAGLAVLLGWQIERLIFSPLDSLRRTMLDCQADSNLAVRAKVFRDDDVGQLAKTYNALMLTMRGITSEVRNEATAVAQEISDLSVLGGEVQANSAAQQDSTMQAAASLEEFTVASSSIAESASEVKKAAVTSRELIEHGHQRINAFQLDLDSISTLVAAIDDAARGFRTSTNEIEKMVKHVREIADQTNLLALNAAIEAARAGEHGRGFAVVADEVRKLAGTSAGTASEIQRVTSEIVANADAVKGVVENTLQSVARGQATMKELTQVLAESDSQFSQTHRGVSDISSATHEQASASTSLAQNVEAISQRGEENDRAMRALADLAVRSNTRAGSLAELVARFK